MIDASDKDFEENIRITKEVVEYAHAHGATVEAELGPISKRDDPRFKKFTDPLMVKEFAERTGIDTRVSKLGHIQRGGSPSAIDRLNASRLGEHAALAIISGLSDIVFGFNRGHVVSINLHDAVNNKKQLNPEFMRLARVLA